MPLSTDIAASLAGPVLMGRQGQSVTYREPNEDDKTVTAVVGSVLAGETPELGGDRVREDVREITIFTDPDDATYGGVADPPLTAAFIITDEGSDVWSVSRIIRKTGSMLSLECVRRMRTEVTREGYRSAR